MRTRSLSLEGVMSDCQELLFSYLPVQCPHIPIGCDGSPRIHEADVADVFAAFDVDRDGIISEKDMTSIMKDQEA